MAKTQWILLLTTFFISCTSLIIIIVSFSTSSWLISEAIHKEATAKNSDIHYGIFSGSLTRFILGERYFNLAVVCLFDEYACMYSCQDTAELREDELRRLLSGQPLRPCPISKLSEKIVDGDPDSNSINETVSQNSYETKIDNEYIDPGLWLTTLICISITVVFAFISAVFAIINIVLNPVEPILSVLGLYIWNGITSAAAVLTLTIWGILFAVSLTENIAITDTLSQSSAYFSDGQASLGYSYWLLCAPALLHVLNIGLLLWRKRLIEMEPPPPTIDNDKTDFTIMLY